MPSPSQSNSNHSSLTVDRSWSSTLKSQGSFGSVPLGPGVPSPSGSISTPFGTPSPSQSASKNGPLGISVISITLKSHGSFGSVPLVPSVPSNTPSPSVSGLFGSVVLPFGLSGVAGSSTPVISSESFNPSLSQSTPAVIGSVISITL